MSVFYAGIASGYCGECFLKKLANYAYIAGQWTKILTLDKNEDEFYCFPVKAKHSAAFSLRCFVTLIMGMPICRRVLKILGAPVL